MTDAGLSYTNQIDFIQAVRRFDDWTQSACPQLIRYIRTKKGREHLAKAFQKAGGTNMHRLIRDVENDPVAVVMAYMNESTLWELFRPFPVNEMIAQPLQKTPFKNTVCEAFRKFRFEIKK